MDDGQKMGTTYSTEKQNVSLAEQCVTNIQIYSNIFYRYWIFEYKYWINTKKLPYSIRMFNYSNNYTNFNHLFMKYSTILSYLLNIRFFSILVFVFDQKSNNICIRLWSQVDISNTFVFVANFNICHTLWQSIWLTNRLRVTSAQV